MVQFWEKMFLGAAFISFLYSNSLYFGWLGPADAQAGVYVGHWVTSILSMLVFLKVTVESSKNRKK